MSVVGIKHRGLEIVGTFVRREVNNSVVLSDVRIVATTCTAAGNIEFALAPYTVFNIDGEITFALCEDCDLFETLPTAISTAYTTAIATTPTISETTLTLLLENPASSLTKSLGLF